MASNEDKPFGKWIIWEENCHNCNHEVELKIERAVVGPQVAWCPLCGHDHWRGEDTRRVGVQSRSQGGKAPEIEIPKHVLVLRKRWERKERIEKLKRRFFDLVLNPGLFVKNLFRRRRGISYNPLPPLTTSSGHQHSVVVTGGVAYVGVNYTTAISVGGNNYQDSGTCTVTPGNSGSAWVVSGTCTSYYNPNDGFWYPKYA